MSDDEEEKKKKKKKKKKKVLIEFLPDYVRNVAIEFIEKVSDEVKIYKDIRMLNGLPPDREADEFAAWWSLGKYHLCPEILTLFYEHWDEINEGEGGLLGTFEDSKNKMLRMYKLAVENNFIRKRV